MYTRHLKLKAGLLTLFSILLWNVVPQASAAILFQNDEIFEMDSDNLVIDYDNDVTGDVYVQLDNETGVAATVTAFTVTGGTDAGAATYTIQIGDDPGTTVPIDTGDDLTQTAADIATDITNNITGYSATNSGAAVIITADATGAQYNRPIAVTVGGNGTVSAISQFTAGTAGTGNGTITWDISAQALITEQYFDLSATAGFRIRESADPANNATCTTLNEIIFDTTDKEFQYCTTVGSPGSWISISATDADTLDGLDSTQFLRSDTSDNYTSGTLTFDDGTTINTASGSTLDVDGSADFSDATELVLNTETSAPTCDTEGEVYYDTTTDQLYVCDGTTWTAAGPQDFEDVYAVDDDNTLDTSGGNFLVSTGAGTFQVTGTLFDVDSTTIDFDPTTFTLDSTTASLDVTESSNFTLTANSASNQTLSISSTNAGAGDGLISITSDNWSINTDGDASLVDITATGDVDFSGATETRLREVTGLVPTGASSTPCTTVGEVAVDPSTGRFYLCTTAGASGTAEWTTVGGAGIQNEDLTFYPEYPDTVIFEDGTNNKGILRALYDDTNDTHYYNWTSKNGSTQDITLKFRFPLPTDFLAVSSFEYEYRTGTTTEADNDVEIFFYNATDSMTLCDSDTTNGTAGVWATSTTDIDATTINTNCTGGSALDAGDIIEIHINLYDVNGGTTFADVGYLRLNYTN